MLSTCNAKFFTLNVANFYKRASPTHERDTQLSTELSKPDNTNQVLNGKTYSIQTHLTYLFPRVSEESQSQKC